MDIKRVNKTGLAIRDVLEKYNPGWANADAINDISKLANDALHASDHHGYVEEMIVAIKSFAAILYSARKHKRYETGSENSVDRVRSIVYSYAYRLSNWAPLK